MTDLLSLIKDTPAFNTVKVESQNGRLSHAYLILTADSENLDNYLKIFAKLAICKEGYPCGKCRACRLIDELMHPDVYFYPRGERAVVTEDITSLIEESYMKPIEGDKKIFVISHAETMNAAAQNKLLKTLEEPPHGVHIFIGATSEYPLLSTIKSRVKKLEIPAFSADKLYAHLVKDYPDEKRLRNAIACSDGTVGKTVLMYGDEGLKNISDLALDVLVNMKSSKDVLEYTEKIINTKTDFNEFLSVIELQLRDLLVIKEGQQGAVINVGSAETLKLAQGFNTGSVMSALESVTEARKRKKFNANGTMLVEWLLFKILEGKHKWQKL